MATWPRENPPRRIVAAGLLAAAIWLGHGCIAGVGANPLPPVGIRQLVAHDRTCIGIEETAICPAPAGVRPGRSPPDGARRSSIERARGRSVSGRALPSADGRSGLGPPWDRCGTSWCGASALPTGWPRCRMGCGCSTLARKGRKRNAGHASVAPSGSPFRRVSSSPLRNRTGCIHPTACPRKDGAPTQASLRLQSLPGLAYAQANMR